MLKVLDVTSHFQSEAVTTGYNVCVQKIKLSVWFCHTVIERLELSLTCIVLKIVLCGVTTIHNLIPTLRKIL